MKKEITLKSYGKINLSLDVGKPMANGMHPVDTVMQLVDLFDNITIAAGDENPKRQPIEISSNREDLPGDRGNLAYRAAELLLENYPRLIPSWAKEISVNIEKNLPVAAGMAGGSGNGAATILGLNHILDMNLSLKELMTLGEKLGADVPFCIMGLAKGNEGLLSKEISEDPMASTCGRGRGTGTELKPAIPLDGAVVIAKPDLGLSTKEVYMGFDKCSVKVRPDNEKLCQGLKEGNRGKVISEMINLLELYSLKAAPEVADLKEKMEETLKAEKVLMSGSGPTVYALFPNLEEAEKGKEALGDVYFVRAARLL